MQTADLTLGGEPFQAALLLDDADVDEFRRWLGSLQGGLVGFDVETTGRQWFHPDFRLTLAAFAAGGRAWVVPGDRRDLLADVVPSLRLVAHNATYDAAAITRWTGRLPKVMGDSMLASLLETPPVDPTFLHGLKEASEREGWTELPAAERRLYRRFRELGGDDRTGWALIEPTDPALWTYNALDAMACYRLRARIIARGDRHVMRLLAREEALQHLWLGSTLRGLRVDFAALRAVMEEQEALSEEAAARLAGLGIDSPRSHDSLVRWFRNEGALFTVFTDKGNPSFAAEAVPSLTGAEQPERVREAATALLAFHEAEGALSKLQEIDGLSLHTGRLHPWIRTLRAKTGRMSIADPALQNIPKGRLREVLIADEGTVLVGADFSQVEFRVAAALSGDERMIRAILDGADLHSTTAAALFGPDFTDNQRRIAKTVGFGWLYGGGARALSQQAGVSLEAAQEVRAKYAEAYPHLAAWAQRLQSLEAVRTYTGRLIPAPEGRSYANTNFMVQSTARDLLAEAVLKLADAGWSDHLWLPVHDEILLQVPAGSEEDALEALGDAMTMTFLGVPIVTEPEVIGERWAA